MLEATSLKLGIFKQVQKLIFAGPNKNSIFISYSEITDDYGSDGVVTGTVFWYVTPFNLVDMY
jgi:hypothetical protein